MENELIRLTAVNEELLRSKGKLVQEIIELKKQIVAQDKSLVLIEQLQTQVNRLNTEIIDHMLNKSILSGQIEELKSKLSLMEMQKENAMMEIDRLNKIKWYQLLFRKNKRY